MGFFVVVPVHRCLVCLQMNHSMAHSAKCPFQYFHQCVTLVQENAHLYFPRPRSRYCLNECLEFCTPCMIGDINPNGFDVHCHVHPGLGCPKRRL